MLEEILGFIIKYWVEWVCIGFSTLLCLSYKTLAKKVKDEKDTDAAMRGGMKALLHDKVIEKCEKCLSKGYCTTDEMDEILYLYEPYKALDGNGSAERALTQVESLRTTPEVIPPVE